MRETKLLRKKDIIMRYGEFGGQYVPQELKERLNEIEREFTKARKETAKKKTTVDLFLVLRKPFYTLFSFSFVLHFYRFSL